LSEVGGRAGVRGGSAAVARVGRRDVADGTGINPPEEWCGLWSIRSGWGERNRGLGA